MVRYRIIYLHRISPLIGVGAQTDQFDAPDDEIALLHLEYELQHTFAEELILERIDQPEITTELKAVQRSYDDGYTESGP